MLMRYAHWDIFFIMAKALMLITKKHTNTFLKQRFVYEKCQRHLQTWKCVLFRSYVKEDKNASFSGMLKQIHYSSLPMSYS